MAFACIGRSAVMLGSAGGRGVPGAWRTISASGSRAPCSCHWDMGCLCVKARPGERLVMSRVSEIIAQAEPTVNFWVSVFSGGSVSERCCHRVSFPGGGHGCICLSPRYCHGHYHHLMPTHALVYPQPAVAHQRVGVRWAELFPSCMNAEGMGERGSHGEVERKEMGKGKTGQPMQGGSCHRV